MGESAGAAYRFGVEAAFEAFQPVSQRFTATKHAAPGFPYPARRRILSLRYLSADARHAPRTWHTSPPFDDLHAELPAGEAMDHPLFPVVWPA